MHEMLDNYNIHKTPILDIGFMYHNKIKKILFEFWNKQDCEDAFTDVYRTINHIDLFVAYFPLDKGNVRELIRMNLEEIRRYYGNGHLMTYDEKVVSYLLSFVQFDGDSPVNGAKDVEFIVQR